jgi:hypothetical protein
MQVDQKGRIQNDAADLAQLATKIHDIRPEN